VLRDELTPGSKGMEVGQQAKGGPFGKPKKHKNPRAMHAKHQKKKRQ
jgi:hypothetical protein